MTRKPPSWQSTRWTGSPRATAEGRELDCGFWLELLGRTSRELHKLNIGTLDAFFVRAVGGFAHELELPPGWRITDEPTAKRLQSDALQDVLGEPDHRAVAEMVRGLAGDEARRSVHGRILEMAGELLGLHHGLDSAAAAEAWSGFDAWSTKTAPGAQGRAALAERLRAAEVPLTKAGQPNKSWADAVRKAADQIEQAEWTDLFKSALGCNAIATDPLERTYRSTQIPDGICEALSHAAEIARAEWGRRFALQCRALERFAGRYADALARRQREAGGFRFDDLTRALGGASPLAGRPDLFYRLDARTLHLLLDEFQDTSRLAVGGARTAGGRAAPRRRRAASAAVVVADPKQSIYGWRGGEPRLVEVVGERYALSTEVRARSFRSSEVVLDFVNEVFRNLAANRIGDRAGRRARAGRAVEPELRAARGRQGAARIRPHPRRARGRKRARRRPELFRSHGRVDRGAVARFVRCQHRGARPDERVRRAYHVRAAAARGAGERGGRQPAHRLAGRGVASGAAAARRSSR